MTGGRRQAPYRRALTTLSVPLSTESAELCSGEILAIFNSGNREAAKKKRDGSLPLPGEEAG